jgi:hypothetical protein
MAARRLALAVNLLARKRCGSSTIPGRSRRTRLEICSMLITSHVGQFFPMRLNLYGVALIRLELPSPVVRWPM